MTDHEKNILQYCQTLHRLIARGGAGCDLHEWSCKLRRFRNTYPRVDAAYYNWAMKKGWRAA